jgi:hypothetical protein
VTYTLTVTNNGNGTESFTLALSGHSWPATLSRTGVSLAAGASTPAQLVVTVPVGTAGGAADTVTVAATAHSDATVSDSVTVTTTASRSYLFLPLVPRDG